MRQLKLGKSQNQFVLDHLREHGYITDTVARNYGIRRLASRVHDLKAAGIFVDKEMKRDDAGVTYAYYYVPMVRRAYMPRTFTFASAASAVMA